MTAEPQPTRRQLYARAFVILLCAAWFWQSPIRRRVLDDKRKPSWSWVLFRGSGKDICDLRLFEKRDGKEVPIDRPSLLGYESSREMPRAVRLLRKPQLESHTRQLCAALHEREGAPVALHGRIRCAGRDKWEKVEDGKRDLCKPKKKRKKKRKKKKKGGAK